MIERGPVDPALAAEFPALAIRSVTLAGGSGRSPESVRARLREMSNRITGAKAVQMRQEPVPWAYRVFFRQVGMNPDEHRTPIEQLVLDRLQHGGFRSRNLLDDAITIATYETGVPLVAFDADRVAPPVGLRLAGDHIVVADSERELGVLFSDPDPECCVTRRTERIVVCAIQVDGVPEIAVEEALWTVDEIVSGA